MSANYSHDDTSTTTYGISNLPTLDFESDYGQSSIGDNTVLYKYSKGNVDQPETLRFSINDVKNVYSGTEIQPGLYSVSKKGKSVSVKLQSTVRETNPVTGVPTDYPVQMWVGFSYPVNASVDASVITEGLKRAISAVFNGIDNTEAINMLMRGNIFRK